MSKRAGNYFSGRTNRTKSEINHAASRAKGSMRDDKKGARRATCKRQGGMDAFRLFTPHPVRESVLLHRPFFIRCRGRFDIPTTDDSALSALDTDARGRHTFNSLLIRRLLLLPCFWRAAPRRTRALPGLCRHSSSLYFEHPTPRMTPRGMNNGLRARRAPSHNRLIGRHHSGCYRCSPLLSYSRYVPASIVPGSCRILRDGIQASDPDRATPRAIPGS